jgi:ubiquinone/menaquinone biosynthesis C-methylase UbiE
MDVIVDLPFIKRKVGGKNAARVVELYSKGEYTKSFAKFRFWYGPLIELNKLVPKSGEILDIGSGEGILSNFLAVSAPRRKILGVEINQQRIKQAFKGIKNVRFVKGDVLKTSLPRSKTIVLSHVLHHLGSKGAQEKLLNNCFGLLKKNGRIIIAEVDKEFSISYIGGWIADVFLIPIFFEKKIIDTGIYHRSRKEWTALLKGMGFSIKYQKVTKDRIYPEVIFVAYK